MTADPFAAEDGLAARPLWLTTLADLGLLLLGFLLLVIASGDLAPRELAGALRAGFGEAADDPAPRAAPMVQEVAFVSGFAAGSAALPGGIDDVARWARGATADPRTRIRIAAGTEGADDIDPQSGSAALLAADRARAVAQGLIAAGVAPGAIEFAGADAAPEGRRVRLTIGFAGTPR